MALVLTKDMSGIGRDYLQTGFYTEVLFRKFGVRFIAIGNGIDSDDPSSSEFAPFVNIMSEWYLRDLSRKQRTAIRVKGESGKPTTNCAIYGYKKAPNDKYHWLIDEEAAAVVRRIFQLTVMLRRCSDNLNQYAKRANETGSIYAADMLPLAAVFCVPLDVANEHFPWTLPLWVQAVLGGLTITAGELAAGLVLNVWLGLDIWDYSELWGNVLGQVCPMYTGLWCLLAGPAIVSFDWIDHWLCGGERPRYRLI